MNVRSVIGWLLATACCWSLAAAAEPPPIDFDVQIARVLLRSCIGCHNAAEPSGGLDLSNRRSMLRGGESGPALAPGKPTESLLLTRASEGEMPPEGKGTQLSRAEVNWLNDWIRQGAPWPEARLLSPLEQTTSRRAGRDWWSLQRVVRPGLPDVSESGESWCRTPIDAFVLQRLQENGLAPSEPADRLTYLRRAKFDLLGLPPTPEEIDAFLADPSVDAYDRLIDRLLASPHYGERWGRHWLDVVAYTESDGFERDKFRPHAWRYRDWVIRSFNADKPYDRFAAEQLAGDALPEPLRDERVATGFLVAGAWDEIQNVAASQTERLRAHEEQIAELIGAVSRTFLGINVGCARCHDHKFDPVPQTDYYSMKAVFDGVDHSRGKESGNRPIFTPAQIQAQRALLAPLQAKQKQLQAELARIDGQFPGDAAVARSDVPALVEGRFGMALNASVTLAAVKSKPAYDQLPLTVECWALARSHSNFNVFVANDLKNSPRHWELYSYVGRGDFSVFLPGCQPSEIRSGVEVTDGRWHHLAMQLEEKQVRLFVDGRQVKQQALTRSKAVGPLGKLFLGGYTPQNIGCDGAVDEVRISNVIRPMDGAPAQPLPADGNTVGLWRFDRLTADRLADVSQPSDAPDRAELQVRRRELVAALKRVAEEIAAQAAPLAYIGFRNQPPATHVLLRGDINTPGPQVVAAGLWAVATPSPQFGLSADAPEAQRRLRFARWVAAGDNPLTARVMVNRIWQYHFGAGLVETPSDFGFGGGLPSHPGLLDYLADELVRSGWSVKRMHRLIMLSAAYRQSSRFDARSARLDADNRLLWRYAPRRLEGEIVRDAMLAASGQLNRRLGGTSFQPFTVKIFNTHFYHLFDSGRPEFNRRTVYRANVITGRDPLLDALDCPVPSVASPRRRTTVTPLQALSLMNDAFVLRQSRRLAERVRGAAPESARRQIELAYRVTLSRRPTAAELAATRKLIDDHDLESACWVLLNSSEFLYVR